jgi:glycosyltransferase involved in cell wall biosynthesis
MINKKNEEISILFFKIIIIIFCILYNIKLFANINAFNLYMKKRNEIKNIETYLKFCKSQKIKFIKYQKRNNPKISIISPVHNRQKYLSRFIKSVQNQNFKNIELILVDDNSLDNGSNIIKKYENKDKRIIVIKNKKNRGTFFSRNIGVLHSRGQYEILPDPDDIISQDILKVSYKYAVENGYEIVRFLTYDGGGAIGYERFLDKLKEKPIYQPELSTYLFYATNNLEINDLSINNKLIKRGVYIKALNELNFFYFNMYITNYEDSIINYLIHRKAKSFYFVKKIGYRYLRNSESVSNQMFKLSEQRINFIFKHIKFLFEYTKNIKREKDIVNIVLTILNRRKNSMESHLSSMNYNSNWIFYYDIINMFLDNEFISEENKVIFKNLKRIIENKNKTLIISRH